MITGKPADLLKQARFSPGIEQALDYLMGINPDELKEGKIAIDGDQVYAIISRYTTREPGETVEIEGHHKYIDVQYIAAGTEAIGWIGLDQIGKAFVYDAKQDAWKCYVPLSDVSMLKLSAGQAAVLFPEDAHCPQLSFDSPQQVVKIVVKVAVQ
ncbi:MAG: DUF386 domain-containing protein [Chloroflexi bacterium]|nr:DUF386 domain-containing protein [Chloroflexota bacterium]